MCLTLTAIWRSPATVLRNGSAGKMSKKLIWLFCFQVPVEDPACNIWPDLEFFNWSKFTINAEQ